jgi:hypothetical protein
MLDQRVRPASQGQRLGKSSGTDVSGGHSCALESAALCRVPAGHARPLEAITG